MSFRQDAMRAGASVVRLLRLLEKLGIYRKPKHITLQVIQDYTERNLLAQKSDPNSTSED